MANLYLLDCKGKPRPTMQFSQNGRDILVMLWRGASYSQIRIPPINLGRALGLILLFGCVRENLGLQHSFQSND